MRNAVLLPDSQIYSIVQQVLVVWWIMECGPQSGFARFGSSLGRMLTAQLSKSGFFPSPL